MKNVIPLNEYAMIFSGKDIIQGTFQLCRKTGIGMMTVSCPEGTATVDIGLDVASPIMQLLPESAPEYA